MNQIENGRYDGDDEALDQLVREAAAGDAVEFVRPSHETIEAFLLGRDTSTQREELGRALGASGAFRREILTMMRDLERVALRAESGTAEAEAAYGEIPELGTFMAGYRRTVARVSGRLVVGILALAAALIFAAVASLVWFGKGNQVAPRMSAGVWHLSQREVDAGLLLSNSVRGGGETSATEISATQEEAALSAFRTHLKLEGVHIVPDMAGAPRGQQAGRTWTVIVLSETATETTGAATYQFSIPSADGGLPVAWWLGLPSRQLLDLAFASDTLVIEWPKGDDSLGLLTIVHEVPGGYAVASPKLLER